MAEIKDPENTIILETTKGKVVHRASAAGGPRPRRAHQGTRPREGL